MRGKSHLPNKENLRAEVLRLRTEGKGFGEIGRLLGISRDAARGHWRRSGAQEGPSPVEALTRPPGDYKPAPDPLQTVKHPSGWEPGIAWDGTQGTVTSRATLERDAKWDDILRHFHFDPEEFEVVEPVQVRTWDAAIGNGEVRQMWYHRANIIRRRAPEDRIDIEELKAEIAKHELPKPGPDQVRGQAFVVTLSDWQLGKRDGDGTRGIVDRAMDGLDAVENRVVDLRMHYGDFLDGTLYLVGMGDLIEGCDNHYPMQTFQAELDRRQQVKVARRLVLAYVKRLAPMFGRVVLACVPGNHGENRKNGKAFTTFGDNDDVALFEQVAEILQENEAYSHVTYAIPGDDLTITLDVAGTVITFAHGHQADRASGANPQAKIESWWQKQSFHRQPASGARVLVTAHYHHFAAKRDGGRTWLQCPSLESESTWFKEQAGTNATPGILTFVTGKGRDFSDLEIL